MHRCPAITTFVNGEVKGYSNLPGSKVTFRCDDKSVRSGKAEITCTEDAEWSDPIPTCNGKPGSLS